MTIKKEPIDETVARLMKKSGFTLSVAESCTGGLLSHRLTNISGSSEYFAGGITTYNNDIKERLLDVPPGILNRFGAVSKEAACAMAKGVRKKFCCTLGLAITGIAGPAGGSRTKPIGTIFIAVSGMGFKESSRFLFKGGREDIKHSATESALRMLIKILLWKKRKA